MSQLGPIDSFHAIGFDLDHTLIRYKLQPFIKVIVGVYMCSKFYLYLVRLNLPINSLTAHYRR